ncbi:RHS repeat-associated core domain-containing protein [Aquimarina algiphila]|uniref:RHS repeat-associated core domain-containing protein n=1 Tax=Aquimarina algiphila TaxID=2047982 RepID=UPI001430A807|nr:RHS repeat-associated core domain-containing protein [Aquimarina algiphila]
MQPATLNAIINKDRPSFSTNLIQSILLNKQSVTEPVHQLLLTKNYPQSFYENVFKNGASYPTDNVLIAMINSSTPRFAENIVQNTLTASSYAHSPSIMSLIANKYNNNFVIVINTHNQGKDPNWKAYCGSPSTSNTLSIQNMTEYEYWDANERGKTTSEGFKKLMNLTDDSINLKYEPSWQLYKTKSYSPQLVSAFTEQEYFYYYDLKNKYLRRQQYADDTKYTELNNQILIDAYQGLEGDVIFLDHGVDGNQHLNLREFLPAGLERSHELNLLNVAYQERTTSKNVSDQHPIARSTYFNYGRDWNTLPSNPIEVRTFNDSALCVIDTTVIEQPNIECIGIYKIDFFDYNTVPSDWGVYIDPVNQKHWICPLDKDTTGTGLILIYENPLNGLPGNVGNKISTIGALGQTLHLRNVTTQIDTLIAEDYYQNKDDIPFASAFGIMEFYIGGVNQIGVHQYEVGYPYDVLTTKTILERNRFTQVQLEENERGLQTRYHYNHFKLFAYQNIACYNGSFSAIESYNIGVPTAVTVGVNRPDSLRTNYEYYPDYSVKRIIDPNGINLSYAYDELGRLKKSYRNGELLSINKYSTWKNDTNLSFNGRTLQNYVETFQHKDRGFFPKALQSRKYIDPLGRDYHTMSREVVNVGASDASLAVVTHTGEIVYNNWNRAEETYKPFAQNGIFIPRLHNTVSALDLPVLAAYENDQKGRITHEAKFGENINNSTRNVKYRYRMANYVCGGCDLDLNAQESNLIMGTNTNNVRFKIVEVEDEDGKKSEEYFNALGQKVATKQFITATQTAITLFVYDSYGNLTKVINPKKQESNYDYNMLGWMYQKQTVDGGITKYMYNESGQVVLEQDERARKQRSCEPVEVTRQVNGAPTLVNEFIDQPYYRSYKYDLFGRLTSQDRVNYESISSSISQQLPLLYTNTTRKVRTTNIPGVTQSTGVDLFHNGTLYYLDLDANFSPINAFVYLFTNNSTYSWKGSTHLFSIGYSGTAELTSHNNYSDLAINSSLSIQPEKKLYYGRNLNYQNNSITNNNIHTTTGTILATARANMRGNLSHTITYSNAACGNTALPIQFSFMGYNSEGNLAWQMHQFNANGINDTTKGIVTRIDYPKYDLNNNLLVENIDVNNDLQIDMQYGYTYDIRNRLKEVRVSLDNDPSTGQLLASYDYNDATGLVIKTDYHKDCTAGANSIIDNIVYTYDVRDRLTNINSSYFNYSMFYDTNMPTTTKGLLNTTGNYNGNINAVQATYSLTSLGGYGTTGTGFNQPSTYAYNYDGINRLTVANAFWDEEQSPLIASVNDAKYGDVNYQFDKIGNITNLKRYISHNNTNEWNYKYLAGSNKLNKVDAISASTADRHYTYDASGNLLTDDFRKVNQTRYGRANLPYDLLLEQDETEKSAQYLYDASDARIFKGLYDLAATGAAQIGLAQNAEYYLRDAAGNTVGILNLNTHEWTWYVFGRERFAKIKPEADQQPQFFTADIGQRNTGITAGSTEKDQFVQELTVTLQEVENTNNQVAMSHLTLNDETERWVSEINLRNFSDYRINNEITITGDKQLIRMDNRLISTGVLTGGRLSYADGTITLPDGVITRTSVDAIAITTGNVLTPDPNLTIIPDGDPVITYTANHSNEFISTISYFNFDHLGNTRLVYTPLNERCDPNGDPIFESTDLEYAADFYPYGKPLREYEPGAEKYVTTHHERDTETGLDYRGARYYDADIARFLSLDPAAIEYPSLSDYNYVAGNPLIFVDPDGKRVDVVTKRWYRKNKKLIQKKGFRGLFRRTVHKDISVTLSNVKLFNYNSKFFEQKRYRDHLKKNVEKSLSYYNRKNVPSRNGKRTVTTSLKIEGKIEWVESLDEVNASGENSDQLIVKATIETVDKLNKNAAAVTVRMGSNMMVLGGIDPDIIAHEFGHQGGAAHIQGGIMGKPREKEANFKNLWTFFQGKRNLPFNNEAVFNRMKNKPSNEK